jgi:hypothetical protein
VLCGFYMPLAVAFGLVQGISNRIFPSFGHIAMFAAFAGIRSVDAAIETACDRARIRSRPAVISGGSA